MMDKYPMGSYMPMGYIIGGSSGTATPGEGQVYVGNVSLGG